MSSGKGHSIDCDKDDMDMEGQVFERVFGQMRRKYASTRSAAAAIFPLLEKLLGRRLYWGICPLHTNDLPLCHLIANVDGPTCSDKGFTDPVCSLLSQVNEMAYDPDFRAVPGSEKIIYIPDNVVNSMSTDSQMCYKLVAAVKTGHLPNAMQEMHCGPLCQVVNHCP